MKLPIPARWSAVLAAFTILIFTLPAQAAGNEVEVDLQNASAEGGETAPIHVEPATVTYQDKSVNGIEVTFEFRDDVWPAVIIPVEVSAKEYPTLVFTAKFNGDNETLNNFGVWVLDKDGNWIDAEFLKNANSSSDGWYEFRWDIANYLLEHPEKSKIDLENLKSVWVKYNIPGIPEGEKVMITFGQMKFEGNPEAQPPVRK